MRTAVLSLLIMLLILTGCRTPRQVKTTELLIVHDSTVINRIDSITIIPVEKSLSVGLDSSHLETSLAVSDAWTDSLGLHHSLQNRAGIQKESKSEIKYIQRDSIQYIPEPYPVEVPAEIKPWQRGLMTIGAMAILLFLVVIGSKLFRIVRP